MVSLVNHFWYLITEQFQKLNNKFSYYLLTKKKRVIFGKNISVEHPKDCVFDCELLKIGDYTGIGSIVSKGNQKAYIGKYCAIGDSVKIITSNHKTSYANINYTLHLKNDFCSLISDKGPVKIGDNVWICDNVIILPGVTIGSGAVIGAGAIVTDNVDPFSVVAGNPAKIIKYRFEKKIIDKLLEISWWNWSEELINKNKKFFETPIGTLSAEEIDAIINLN